MQGLKHTLFLLLRHGELSVTDSTASATISSIVAFVVTFGLVFGITYIQTPVPEVENSS